MTELRLSLLVLGAFVVAQFNEWQPLDRALVAGAVLLVLAYLWSRNALRGISVTRRLASDRAQVGQVVADQITLRNRSLLGKLWIEVRDHSSLPGHSASRVVNVRGRTTSQWTAQTVAAKRGRYQLGPVILRSGDPFGIFPSRIRMRGAIDLLVYPPSIDLPGFGLPGSPLSGGPRPDRRSQTVTPMVTGVREYVQGDAFNRISWSASARLSRLMVKEFDIDPTSDVWIVLDLDHDHRVRERRPNPPEASPGAGPVEAWLDSTEEYGVTIAASIARACLIQGRGVGLIASGAHHEVIQADRSDRAYIKILESLAVVMADGNRPLAEVLVAESRRFNRNSALIVITSSTDTGWVDAIAMHAARRVQASVVWIDGESFGEAESSDQVMDRLAKARIRSYKVRNGDRIADALRLSGA